MINSFCFLFTWKMRGVEGWKVELRKKVAERESSVRKSRVIFENYRAWNRHFKYALGFLLKLCLCIYIYICVSALWGNGGERMALGGNYEHLKVPSKSKWLFAYFVRRDTSRRNYSWEYCPDRKTPTAISIYYEITLLKTHLKIHCHIENLRHFHSSSLLIRKPHFRLI